MIDQHPLSPDGSPDSVQPSEDVWREEIQQRVARYRHRRGRRIEGAFSMRFPFDSGEAAVAEGTDYTETDSVVPPADAVRPSPGTMCAEDRDAAYGLAPSVEAPEINSSGGADCASGEEIFGPPPESERAGNTLEAVAAQTSARTPKPNIIAFPRPATAPTRRLADPVTPEQLRILDVPEKLEAFTGTPLLDGLRLGADSQRAPAAPADHIDLPFQAATIPRRLYAALVDGGLVALASGVFAAATYKLLPKLPHTKPLLIVAAALPLLLWGVYQYVFLMYAGRTIGMQMAGVRLSTFQGTVPNWRQRRSRLIGLYFSTASLGMGLLWGLVDIDALCWHDRISHTYPTICE